MRGKSIVIIIEPYKHDPRDYWIGSKTPSHCGGGHAGSLQDILKFDLPGEMKSWFDLRDNPAADPKILRGWNGTFKIYFTPRPGENLKDLWKPIFI